MALFCSSCKPPILCPKFRRNYAIPNPFTSKTSISKAPNFEISKIWISAPAKIPNEKIECSSNLISPVELDEGPSSNVIIFIKGLAKSTVEGGLKMAFSRFGEVTRVKVILDKKTKQSLGFAYVWFTREEHARAAVDEMNGQGGQNKPGQSSRNQSRMSLRPQILQRNLGVPLSGNNK